MGLGSCRPLLESQVRLRDFDLRPILGPSLPFFANLGIAQVEDTLAKKETGKIAELIHLLRADGLIIHVNPLQEWLQPEGDHITRPPVDTIAEFVEQFPFPVIIKEVGQGMGPKSLHALLRLPIAAIEFAAFGGTNFAKLELLRAEKDVHSMYANVARIGHTAEEMVRWINELTSDAPGVHNVEYIISGGIKDFLDGYHLTSLLKKPAVYGQAATLLTYAMESQEALDQFLTRQIRGLQFARTYLCIR
jgi:isopentenyl-diphosphate delta-isomerase